MSPSGSCWLRSLRASRPRLRFHTQNNFCQGKSFLRSELENSFVPLTVECVSCIPRVRYDDGNAVPSGGKCLGMCSGEMTKTMPVSELFTIFRQAPAVGAESIWDHTGSPVGWGQARPALQAIPHSLPHKQRVAELEYTIEGRENVVEYR